MGSTNESFDICQYNHGENHWTERRRKRWPITLSLDYSKLSWETFEDLCSTLWFDEGYTGIKPYGRYKERGRDTVHFDSNQDELVIFQYKRWTSKKSLSQFKKEVNQEIDKVNGFGPHTYILNSALAPVASFNDWIQEELQGRCDFDVQYWDRSWLDLRLNNRRQDLRRRLFGVELERHTWISLIASCQA